MDVYLTLDLLAELRSAPDKVQAVRILRDKVAESGVTLGLKFCLDIVRAVREPGAVFPGGYGPNRDSFLVKF